MIASSPPNKPSYWGDQTKPMKEVFIAIAEKSSGIDPNQDGIITAKELAAFMNGNNRGSGDLLFARNGEEPIFGWIDLANSIPVAQNGRIINVPDNYVPIPF